MHLIKYSKHFIVAAALVSSASISWAASKPVTLIEDVSPQYFQLLQSEQNKWVYIKLREISYKANAASKNSLLETVSKMRIFDSQFLNKSIVSSIQSGVIRNGLGQGIYTINGRESFMTVSTSFPYIKSIQLNSENNKATFEQGKVDYGLSVTVTSSIYNSNSSSIRLNLVVNYSQLINVKKNRIAGTDYYTELPNVHNVRYVNSLSISPTESIVYKLGTAKDWTKYLIITAATKQAF